MVVNSCKGSGNILYFQIFVPNLSNYAVFPILMPPISSFIKRINTLLDKVRVLGCQFLGIIACNDAEKGEIALDVLAPMVLNQAETQDVVKLCLRLGQLYMGHDMGFSLLV
jgi:hypothetical protein